MTKLDSKINNLKAGETLNLCKTSSGETFVERSGDGKLLRYVRVIGNITTVFKKENF